ncbi:jasmonate ZIM domain-containing protein 1-like [Lotus japonicus]|uniref:jasmonate ZIM domain-containing protein 1-like n=1 Tax=Lotus japonicus TaxID=34305 RepID=UPI002583AC73|nr:jasmonate ZIM domain-containing protein 1-like [Lotus japonicus]
MATFPNTVADGRSSGKALEKSNFSQTCSLLSKFLKEKRGSGDSVSGMGGKMDPKACTKDLLANLQKSDGTLRPNASSAMDILPQLVENPCIKKSNVRSAGPKTPQLTIFYAGKLLVFDGFVPEKATEVMELATKLASDSSSSEENSPKAPVVAEKLKESKAPQTNLASETSRPGNQAVRSDMRYPRRASLLKFLEKRKERVIAKGPYQVNNPKHEGSSSGGEPEDQSSKHLDLNL